MNKFLDKGWIVLTVVAIALLVGLSIWDANRKRNDCLDVGGRYVFDHWQSTGNSTIAIYVCVKEPNK